MKQWSFCPSLKAFVSPFSKGGKKLSHLLGKKVLAFFFFSSEHLVLVRVSINFIVLWSWMNRDFKMPQRQRQRESQKSNRLNRQNNNSARASHFFSISFPSLHDYNGKMPNFTFYGRHKQVKAKFSFSFWTWIWFLGIRFKKSSLAFDKVN